VLVARVGNLAPRDLTRYERAIQFHAKPFPEFTVIRQRTPDPRNWRLAFNTLLNTFIHYKQPPGCRLALLDGKRNLFVAFSAAAFPPDRESAFEGLLSAQTLVAKRLATVYAHPR